MDIALILPGQMTSAPLGSGPDLGLTLPDLNTSTGLHEACLISLFTDRQVSESELPDPLTPGELPDLGGWWGDVLALPAMASDPRIGSKLWLLRRAKLTQETLNRAKQYATEALAWLVSDGVAREVNVGVERFVDENKTFDARASDAIAIQVTITRPDGSAGRYDFVWS